MYVGNPRWVACDSPRTSLYGWALNIGSNENRWIAKGTICTVDSLPDQPLHDIRSRPREQFASRDEASRKGFAGVELGWTAKATVNGR